MGGANSGRKPLNSEDCVANKSKTWDWTKRDSDLARENSLSREYVRLLRLKLGKEKAMQSKILKIVTDHKDELASSTIAEFAKKLNIGYGYLSAIIKKLALPHKVGVRGKKSKYDWDKVDWTKTVVTLAAEMGLTVNHVNVAKYRLEKRLGVKLPIQTPMA